MKRIVAIGGPHGSGKSSVAKRLANELMMTYISAGEIFRQTAIERGVTLEELSERVKTEPDLDRHIDQRTKELGNMENTVVDAQLAAYFTPEDIALKMSISATFETRCKRIAKRENISIENATQETKVREKSERKRFIELYDIDVNDLDIYDVILNNDRMNEEKTYQMPKRIVIAALDL